VDYYQVYARLVFVRKCYVTQNLALFLGERTVIGKIGRAECSLKWAKFQVDLIKKIVTAGGQNHQGLEMVVLNGLRRIIGGSIYRFFLI